MNADSSRTRLIEIETDTPIWDRFFTVAPLVLIGTKDEDGSTDLAPKHMVTPLGWQNFFGFVCAPTHATCGNILRTGEFTVSYPETLAGALHEPRRLSSGRRTAVKPVLDYFTTFPASKIDGDFIDDAYLYFECRHHKTYDDFGPNCLITGEIVAACAEPRLHSHVGAGRSAARARVAALRLPVAWALCRGGPLQFVPVPGRHEEVRGR